MTKFTKAELLKELERGGKIRHSYDSGKRRDTIETWTMGANECAVEYVRELQAEGKIVGEDDGLPESGDAPQTFVLAGKKSLPARKPKPMSEIELANELARVPPSEFPTAAYCFLRSRGLEDAAIAISRAIDRLLDAPGELEDEVQYLRSKISDLEETLEAFEDKVAELEERLEEKGSPQAAQAA